MKRRNLCFAVSAAFIVAVAGTAHGHGDLRSTIPKSGATVRSVPSHIAVQFTEPPTKQSKVKVADGCGRNVTESVAVQGDTTHIQLAAAQPGTFRVSYNIVSEVDGHPSQGSYKFKVQGKRDCSSRPSPPAGEGENQDDGESRAGGQEPEADSSSTVWFILVPTATVALLGIALLARRAGSRSIVDKS